MFQRPNSFWSMSNGDRVRNQLLLDFRVLKEAVSFPTCADQVCKSFLSNKMTGKSTLSENLYNRLAASPHCLRVAFLSLDDLYRPHAELEQLKLDFPHNKLLHGRGQPGTHDVRLGTDMLRQLRHINDNKQPVHLPVYGKSLNEGQGDRLTQSRPVQGPLVKCYHTRQEPTNPCL